MNPDDRNDDFVEDDQPWRPDQAAQIEGLDLTDQTHELSAVDQAAQDPDDAGVPQDQPLAEAPAMSDIEITPTVVMEAVLFCADEPVSPQKLAEIIGAAGIKEIRQGVEELNDKYDRMDCTFRIESIAGGYQMLTLPDFNPWLRKLLKVRGETKLTPASLETLAIIAYKQPILRVDVENIRGVAAGEMVRQLIDKGLVKIVGRAEELGRPMLYGTTRKFLEVFGLSTLKDLPSAEDLKKPD